MGYASLLVHYVFLNFFSFAHGGHLKRPNCPTKLYFSDQLRWLNFSSYCLSYCCTCSTYAINILFEIEFS